ncbi:MAG: glycosyltransferase family 2 protein, partial [Pseudomonadota bacterium]
MDYASERVTVWLLDDGGTRQKMTQDDAEAREAARERSADLMELCNRLDVRYLARERNEMAKAGNLNFGLEHSTGELVVVLDADHAPRREFLTETVGHFKEDPRLFLVQTPHAFLNDDPIERNLAVPKSMPAEHQMFYKSLQKGLDSWNGSYFCGSAAVMRREALAEVGGFAGVSVTEDCESALELHARGWNSRFVDKPLIWGLQPETFTSLIKQRSRWCSGMLQIFILKNPLIKRGLTVAQRICYATSCLYWFFPVMRMTFVIAPLLYIFFNMEIFMSSTSEFLAYTAPYIAAVVLLQGFLYGRHRWAWMSEVYEYVQSIHLVKSVFGTMVAPRRPQFNVTPKGFVLDEEKLSTLATPYFLVFGVLLIGLAVAMMRIISGEAQSLLYIVTGWNVFNLIVAGMALGAVCDRRELRFAPRLGVSRAAELVVDGRAAPCTVENVSHRGIMCLVNDPDLPVAPGNRVSLRVKAGEETHETTLVVRRRAGKNGDKRIGASFEILDEHRFCAVAELMCASKVTMRDRMIEASGIRARNLFIWTAEFLAYAVRETVRGLSFVLGAQREKAHPHLRTAPKIVFRRRELAGAPKVSIAVAIGLAAATLVLPQPAGAQATSIRIHPLGIGLEDSASEVRGAEASVEADRLRRLAVPDGRLFLQGEWQKVDIPVHFDAGEIGHVKALEVSAITSAPTLLSATSVDAYVNGALIGRVVTDTAAAASTEITMPQGLLAPGWNVLTFTARHQHRVSCSIDAGYELWTRIDKEKSGFVMDGAAPMPSLAGLISTAAQPGRFNLEMPADEDGASRIINLSNLLTRLAKVGAPEIVVSRDGADRDGTEVSIGSARAHDGWAPVPGTPGLKARLNEGSLTALRLDAADGA